MTLSKEELAKRFNEYNRHGLLKPKWVKNLS